MILTSLALPYPGVREGERGGRGDEKENGAVGKARREKDSSWVRLRDHKGNMVSKENDFEKGVMLVMGKKI